MKTSTKVLGAAALLSSCMAASAVVGYVSVEHERIVLSTVDSTPIGNTTPSSGAFTNFSASGQANIAGGLTVNGLVNKSQLTTSGIQDNGSLAVTGQVNVTGGLTVNGLVNNNALATDGIVNNGPYTSSSSVTAPSFIGNAATASALLSGGGTCANSFRSVTGMSASGSISCGPMTEVGSIGGGCTTGSASYSTCSNFVSFATSFPDNQETVACSGIGPSDPRAYVNVTGVAANGVTVTTVTGGSVAVSFSSIACIGQHP